MEDGIAHLQAWDLKLNIVLNYFVFGRRNEETEKERNCSDVVLPKQTSAPISAKFESLQIQRGKNFVSMNFQGPSKK